MNQRAIFLDKDGTLLENVPYNVNPEQIRLLPGAEEGLQLLQAAGFHLVVVSNQSGVARGLFSERALVVVEERLRSLLVRCGVSLDRCYFCPHHPTGVVPEYAVECNCRKPQPGLLLQAAQDFCLDLSQSWMVGDSPSDVEAGQRAGCRTLFLGNPREPLPADAPQPDSIVADLAEAARFILAASPPVRLNSARPSGAGPLTDGKPCGSNA